MTSATSQTQHEIPLRFSDGTEGVAVRTGDHAAWFCVCTRRWPLIGHSDAVAGNPASIVRCPNCARKYRVVARGLRDVPTHVQEMPDIQL